jgi:hypothetical protein
LTGRQRKGGALALLQEDSDRSFVNQVASTLASVFQSLDQVDLKAVNLKQALESNTSRLEQLLSRAGGAGPPAAKPAESTPQPKETPPDLDIFGS